MADSTPLVLQNSDPWVVNQRIFHILNTYLQPNTTLSPSNVAQEIDKVFPLNRPREEDTRENEEPESFLFEMWGVIISVAEQIPWKHRDSGQTRLVEVIQALKDLPGSTTLKFDYWSDMELWSDLPMLGAVMTEKCYCMRFILLFLPDLSLALLQPSIWKILLVPRKLFAPANATS